jgi:hypothetical protein
VPTELALLALRQSGIDVTAQNIRKWIYRGRIHRHDGGQVDLGEIVEYLKRHGVA